MRSVTGASKEDISHVRTAADGGGGRKRKCVGKRMDNADEERSVGRRKERVSRRRSECRGNTARARK